MRYSSRMVQGMRGIPQMNNWKKNAEQSIANRGINNKSSLPNTDYNHLNLNPSVNPYIADEPEEIVDNSNPSGRKRRKSIYSEINLNLNIKVLEGDRFVVMDKLYK